MAELARKYQKTAIKFPQQNATPDNIVMTAEELQNVIAAAIAASKKRANKSKPTRSLYKTNGVKKPTAADPIRSKEDFHKMVDYLGSTGKDEYRLRNQTLFVLGCGLGLRCGDLLHLRTSDVYTPTGQVKKYVELIEEKTRKRNVCKIPAMAERYLKAYLVEQKFIINDKTFLFQSERNQMLSLKRVYYILNEAGKACGIEGKISTHSMRKTYAIAALKSAENTGSSGETIEMLQEKFKHSDQRITMRYCKAEQGKVDEMSDRVSDYLDGE